MPKLGIVSLVSPAMLVLGTVVGKEKQPHRRKALQKVVEERLGFRIDPVKVFEH